MVVALSAAVATVEVEVTSVAAVVVEVKVDGPSVAAGASRLAVAVGSTLVVCGVKMVNPAIRS